VLADGVVVGRIFNSNAGPVGSPWMWTLAFGHHEDGSPTHGYAATRDDEPPSSQQPSTGPSTAKSVGGGVR
jgi:hypothetical protein